MLIVPKRSLVHLNSANESEIARLESAHKEHGDDWPEGFDVNDISLHEIVRDQLQAANLENSEVVNFDDWKGLWFLIRLIPRYIENNETTLSREDAATLMDVYNQKK
ncbi:hypothetical protein [Sphingomonas oryzagri]